MTEEYNVKNGKVEAAQEIFQELLSPNAIEEANQKTKHEAEEREKTINYFMKSKNMTNEQAIQQAEYEKIISGEKTWEGLYKNLTQPIDDHSSNIFEAFEAGKQGAMASGLLNASKFINGERITNNTLNGQFNQPKIDIVTSGLQDYDMNGGYTGSDGQKHNDITSAEEFKNNMFSDEGKKDIVTSGLQEYDMNGGYTGSDGKEHNDIASVAAAKKEEETEKIFGTEVEISKETEEKIQQTKPDTVEKKDPVNQNLSNNENISKSGEPRHFEAARQDGSPITQEEKADLSGSGSEALNSFIKENEGKTGQKLGTLLSADAFRKEAEEEINQAKLEEASNYGTTTAENEGKTRHFEVARQNGTPITEEEKADLSGSGITPNQNKVIQEEESGSEYVNDKEKVHQNTTSQNTTSQKTTSQNTTSTGPSKLTMTDINKMNLDEEVTITGANGNYSKVTVREIKNNPGLKRIINDGILVTKDIPPGANTEVYLNKYNQRNNSKPADNSTLTQDNNNNSNNTNNTNNNIDTSINNSNNINTTTNGDDNKERHYDTYHGEKTDIEASNNGTTTAENEGKTRHFEVARQDGTPITEEEKADLSGSGITSNQNKVIQEEESGSEYVNDKEKVHQNTTSQNTTSQNTTSQNTTSQNTTSQNTTSQNTTSQNTTSQNTTSQNTTSQNTTSQNTTSQNTTSTGPSRLTMTDINKMKSDEEVIIKGVNGNYSKVTVGEIKNNPLLQIMIDDKNIDLLVTKNMPDGANIKVEVPENDPRFKIIPDKTEDNSTISATRLSQDDNNNNNNNNNNNFIINTNTNTNVDTNTNIDTNINTKTTTNIDTNINTNTTNNVDTNTNIDTNINTTTINDNDDIYDDDNKERNYDTLDKHKVGQETSKDSNLHYEVYEPVPSKYAPPPMQDPVFVDEKEGNSGISQEYIEYVPSKYAPPPVPEPSSIPEQQDEVNNETESNNNGRHFYERKADGTGPAVEASKSLPSYKSSEPTADELRSTTEEPFEANDPVTNKLAYKLDVKRDEDGKVLYVENQQNEYDKEGNLVSSAVVKRTPNDDNSVTIETKTKDSTGEVTKIKNIAADGISSEEKIISYSDKFGTSHRSVETRADGTKQEIIYDGNPEDSTQKITIEYDSDGNIVSGPKFQYQDANLFEPDSKNFGLIYKSDHGISKFDPGNAVGSIISGEDKSLLDVRSEWYNYIYNWSTQPGNNIYDDIKKTNYISVSEQSVIDAAKIINDFDEIIAFAELGGELGEAFADCVDLSKEDLVTLKDYMATNIVRACYDLEALKVCIEKRDEAMRKLNDKRTEIALWKAEEPEATEEKIDTVDGEEVISNVETADHAKWAVHLSELESEENNLLQILTRCRDDVINAYANLQVWQEVVIKFTSSTTYQRYLASK